MLAYAALMVGRAVACNPKWRRFRDCGVLSDERWLQVPRMFRQ